MENSKQKQALDFFFSQKNSVQFFFFALLFLCFQKSIKAQDAETEFTHSLNFEFGYIAYTPHLSGYQLDLSYQTNHKKEKLANVRLGISYPITKRHSLGISLITNSLSEGANFKKTELIGTTSFDEITQTNYTYNNSYKSLKINDNYFTLKFIHKLFERNKFNASIGLGINLLRIKQEYYEFDIFGNNADFSIFSSQSVDKNIAGAELSLAVSAKLTNALSLSLSPTYIYSTGKASPYYNSNFQYFNLETKLTLSLAKEHFANTENAKNIIMVSLGFPFSISYEYLLAKKQVTHSLRGYIGNYLTFETFPGIAYNIKFGGDKLFFITELNTILRHGISIGPNIGVERQTEKRFVYRFTVGVILKQKAIPDASDIPLPLAELHFGHAF